MRETSTPTPSQRWEARKSAAALIRAEVRRRGTGGIDAVAKELSVDAVTVRRWSAGLTYPAWTMAQRVLATLKG